MKMFILSILSIIGYCIPSIAQTEKDYHPFLKEGKTWNCRLYEEQAQPEEIDGKMYRFSQTTFYSLTIDGDTIVGDKSYKKMYRKPTMVVRKYISPAEVAGKTDTIDITSECTLWYELWREEGRKVYACIYGQEQLRYDFSAEPGSTVDIGGISMTIAAVDTISLCERKFACYHVTLADYPDTNDRIWIEGVGHPDGPFRVWGAEVNDGRQYTLFSCYEDGVCIYSAEEYEKWKQSLGIAPQQAVTPRTPAQGLYDLQGRKVTGTATRGIYVKDGRKVVVK